MAALTFPLALAEFQDALRIAEFRMELVEPQQTARLADGTVIRSSLGEALWRGSFSVNVEPHDDAAAMEARLALAWRPGSSVLLTDPRRNGPREDPGGATLGASSVTVVSVTADRREVAIEGLPAGYVLSSGDLLGWTYGSSPTRYAVHRIVVGDDANENGRTAAMEVVPPIRTGVSAGDAVTLVRPAMKAVLTSAEFGTGGPVLTAGATVEFVQTLR